jgi:aspartate/methionine/tyrosine aminotransferase
MVKNMKKYYSLAARTLEVDWSGIRMAITRKTKLMIINTPANPTGAMYDIERIGRGMTALG